MKSMKSLAMICSVLARANNVAEAAHDAPKFGPKQLPFRFGCRTVGVLNVGDHAAVAAYSYAIVSQPISRLEHKCDIGSKPV